VNVMFLELEKDMIHRLSLLRECLNELRTVCLVTLGPEGTSSEVAAQYFLDQVETADKTLVLCSNYEQAADKVVAGVADLLLVANAYKGINDFYMSPALYFICAYFYQTPMYGVAARKDWAAEPNRRYTIATHHAPISLVPWFLQGMALDYDLVHADSTAAAARAVRTGETDLCVANAVAVAQQDLEFVTRTRPIRMLWSVFQRKRDE